MSKSFSITSKGVDYLTELINSSRWTKKSIREEDLLGILESKGFGFRGKQLIGLLRSRDIRDPLMGTEKQYRNTLKDLVKRELVVKI